MNTAPMRCTSRTWPSRSSDVVSPPVALLPALSTIAHGAVLGAGRERDPDVVQVVGRHDRERDRAVEREPPQQRRIGPAPDDRPAAAAGAPGRRSRRRAGRRSRPPRCRTSRRSMHSRSPTCPSPTTITWSDRGTARRPSSPVRLRPISRSTSPPVNAAAKSSATSMLERDRDLEPLGPVLNLRVRIDGDERLDRSVVRVDQVLLEHDRRRDQSPTTRMNMSPTAPKKTSAALWSNGLQDRRRQRAHRGARAPRAAARPVPRHPPRCSPQG